MKNFLYSLILLTTYTPLNGMQNINSLDETEIRTNIALQSDNSNETAVVTAQETVDAEYKINHSLDQEFIDALIAEHGIALNKSQLTEVENLLKSNPRPDINVKFNHIFINVSRDCTPLIYAVTNLDYNLVKLLLKYGANVNEKNDKNFTPLMAAIKEINRIFSNEKLAQYTISKDAQNKQIAIIDALLKEGADIQTIDTKGHTALSYAALLPDYVCLKHLLYQPYTLISETALFYGRYALAYSGGLMIEKIIQNYRLHCSWAEDQNKKLRTVQPIINSSIDEVNELTNIIVDYAQTTADHIRQEQEEK